MPERISSAARGTARLFDFSAFGIASASVLGLAVAAAVAAARFATGGATGPLLLPTVAVLSLSSLWQAWGLSVVVRNRCFHRLQEAWICVHFWHALLSGAAVLYILALVVGPISGIGWFWLAALALWQNVLLLPLAASPRVAENWRRWIESHRPGRLNWLVAATIVCLALAEGALQVRKYLASSDSEVPLGGLSQLHASVRKGAMDAGWEQPFTANRGRFRIALVSDPEHSAANLNSLSVRIQQAVSGAEVISFDKALGETPSALTAELQESQPDVVLAVLPACAEWVSLNSQRSLFDPDRFELAKRLLGTRATALRPGNPRHTDYETFLNRLVPELAACRTPLDEPMRVRWDRTFAALDQTIESCRKAEVPIALVVVPAELQLNRGLRSTLLRRNGMTAEQLDLELPQRRLADYAQLRAVPVLDLLPHLRHCRQTVYARNETPLSDSGNVVAASAIGGWLESRYGDQLAAQLSRTK